MRFATLAYTKPDARYDVIEFEAPVFRERIITTMRRKNKISFSLISNSQSSGRLPISLPNIAIFLYKNKDYAYVQISLLDIFMF